MDRSKILLLVIVFSAIFGFIYEELFYRIDLGHFVKRGTTYGPWIPIYGFGGLFIAIITYHFRKKPVLVLLLSALVSGTLEFLTYLGKKSPTSKVVRWIAIVRPAKGK